MIIFAKKEGFYYHFTVSNLSTKAREAAQKALDEAAPGAEQFLAAAQDPAAESEMPAAPEQQAPPEQQAAPMPKQAAGTSIPRRLCRTKRRSGSSPSSRSCHGALTQARAG